MGRCIPPVAEAESLLLESYDGLKQREYRLTSDAREYVCEAADRLVRLYGATNQPDKAKAWRAKHPPASGAPASAAGHSRSKE